SRLIQRVGEEGDKGVIHQLRGRVSNRKIADEIRQTVIDKYSREYAGFGPTLAMEKLMERDGIKISDETLRKWLIVKGIPYPKRKKRPHRRWRERKDYFGQMVQMDGSHHDWFEGRGPKCVLMGYIDDATGEVFGCFYEYEGTIPAMDSFKRYIEKYGIPLSVYVDRHSTYRSTGKPTIEDELEGKEPMSEFERALQELGVSVIHALSPQAKGRIERLFRTFQDRLIKEMRLEGIGSIQEANTFLEEYLPVYNKRFRVCANKEGDMHRAAEGIDLAGILCIKAQRTLRNDFTISYNKRLYQIEDTIRAHKVIIEERLDGTLWITHQGRALRYTPISSRPARKEAPLVHGVGRKAYRPSPDHPWKKFPISPLRAALKKEELVMAKT
ncbi:MAG: ISNCY family transposase, partial [Deltaproteobacteria bacterium]|nr:ISNCY family transposase [Deltaproteobacteria bacterium]